MKWAVVLCILGTFARRPSNVFGIDSRPLTADGKAVPPATRPQVPAGGKRAEVVATSAVDVVGLRLQDPTEDESTTPDQTEDGSTTLDDSPPPEDGSPAGGEMSLFGFDVHLPPPEEGPCLARTILLHFQGVKTKVQDEGENAGIDGIAVMYALCAVSLVVLLFGHVLVRSITCVVVVGLAFDLVFAALAFFSHSCSTPVYGGLAVAALAMYFATAVMDSGFVAIGAGVGAVAAMEFQNLLFSFRPGLERYLQDTKMESSYYVFALMSAIVAGLVVKGRIDKVLIGGTAFIGAFGLQLGIRCLLGHSGHTGISETHGLIMMSGFFLVGFFVQPKFGQKDEGVREAKLESLRRTVRRTVSS